MQQRREEQLDLNSPTNVVKTIDEKLLDIFNKVTPEELKCTQNIENFGKKLNECIYNQSIALSSEEQQYIKNNVQICYINNNGNAGIGYGLQSFSHHFIAFYKKQDGETIILDYDIPNCIDNYSTTNINASEYLFKLFYEVCNDRINDEYIKETGHKEPNSFIYDLPQFLLLSLNEWDNLYQNKAHDLMVYYFSAACRGSVSSLREEHKPQFSILDTLMSQGAVFINLSEMFLLLDNMNKKSNLLQDVYELVQLKDPTNKRMSQEGLAYHPDHFNNNHIKMFNMQLQSKYVKIKNTDETSKFPKNTSLLIKPNTKDLSLPKIASYFDPNSKVSKNTVQFFKSEGGKEAFNNSSVINLQGP